MTLAEHLLIQFSWITLLMFVAFDLDRRFNEWMKSKGWSTRTEKFRLALVAYCEEIIRRKRK